MDRPDFENIDYRSATEAQKALRDEYIWKLRVRGLTLRQIVSETGIDMKTVGVIIKRVATEIVREPAEAYLAMQLARLDELKQKYLAIAEKHKVSFSQSGRPLSLDGTPVDDDGPAIQAYSKYLDVLKEESKLLGLYAPEKKEVSNTVSVEPSILNLIKKVEDEDQTS